jgi:RNA polymerase sigma-32 factor
VPEIEVISMNQRLSGPDFSLNAPLNAEIGEQWQDQLADESSNQEQTLAASEERSRQSALLRDALSRLGARERDILMSRRLRDTPATLGELAEKYGVSYERARQIEVHALDKLRRTMRHMH